MKLLNILAFGAAAVSLASCADDFDPTYKVEMRRHRNTSISMNTAR